MYWKQVPHRRDQPLPMARTHHSVVAHNNRLWVFGGMSHQHSTPLGVTQRWAGWPAKGATPRPRRPRLIVVFHSF